MNTQIIRKTAVAALAAASLAGFVTMSSTQPAAAVHKFGHLLGAAIVGGIIVNELSKNNGRGDRRYNNSSYNWENHVDWCYDNRPRYRERDNTFRRSGQRRRECFSPYYN